jgi:virulence-associated protein VapD
MAAQKRFKAINFDLDTKSLKREFGDDSYRKGYSLIRRFLTGHGFLHHQYSGYISKAAMSYGEIYILITDIMVTQHPWIIDCVNKFDATNVTSQSNMLSAIKAKKDMDIAMDGPDIENEDSLSA